MSVSPDMYIVISLMFAVFAAVAAVGTSLVLGVGFERLRIGFEIVKKQTGFFADAIHQLDQRTDVLETKQDRIEKSVSHISHRVERVEKQTDFFFDSLNSLESQILKGQPATSMKQDDAKAPQPVMAEEKPMTEVKEKEMPAKVIHWTATSQTNELLKSRKEINEKTVKPEISSSRLASSLFDYLLNDNRTNIYH